MKKSIWAVLVVVSCAVGTSAQAQDKGAYFGGGIFQSDAKDWCNGVVGSCDDNDTSWRVFGGYQINKWFGVELGYADLGNVSASGTFAGTPFTANASATTIELVGVGTFPINEQFGVFGKLGAHRWDLDVSTTVAGTPFSRSGTGTDLTYGVGLQVNITKNISARLEWQRYNDVGDTGPTDVDTFGASLVVKLF